MMDYIVTMAQYNQWMNRKVYEVAANLSDNQRVADRGAFFKSVQATLGHLIWADKMWMSRFLNRPEYVIERSTIDELSFADMKELRFEIDAEILQWAETVKETWLASDLIWTSQMYQKTFTRPVLLCVMQLFNHQTHHRGQVTTLLTQYGLDVGVTDLPLIPQFLEYGEN